MPSLCMNEPCYSVFQVALLDFEDTHQSVLIKNHEIPQLAKRKLLKPQKKLEKIALHHQVIEAIFFIKSLLKCTML